MTVRARASALLGSVLVLLALPATAGADLRPILIDGHVDEWGDTPLYEDAVGDGSVLDLTELHVAHDQDWLFLRFELTEEIALQEDSDVVIYLDTDTNPATGVSVGGVGAELRWQFGHRNGTYYGAPPPDPLDWDDIRLRAGPTTRSTVFEVSISRHALPDGVNPLFTQDEIHLLLRDEDGTDRIPDLGETLAYTFTAGTIDHDFPIALDEDDPDHVRIMSWNVEGDGPWDPALEDRYERVFEAVVPDIVCFQEVYDHTGGEAFIRLNGWLGGVWYSFKSNPDVITVSRYPYITAWTNEVPGNLIGLLDTEDELGHPLLLINCHLPCCDNDAGRQDEVDELMAFVRDAITPGVGAVDLDENTPIVITGDLNLVGDPRQLRTLLDGDILDEVIYGADFTPDWDGTSLLDLAPTHTETRDTYTWRRDTASLLPSRLDRMIHTDAVLGLGNHYVLYTPDMSPAELAQAGLEADDTRLAADHLPVVVDFTEAMLLGVAPGASRGNITIGVAPNPARVSATVSVDLDAHASLTVTIHDVTGRRVRSLRDGLERPAGRYEIRWDARDDTGRDVPAGVYFARVRATALAGGHTSRTVTLQVVR